MGVCQQVGEILEVQYEMFQVMKLWSADQKKRRPKLDEKNNENLTFVHRQLGRLSHLPSGKHTQKMMENNHF
jgi:hypothetical protein